MNEKKKLSAVSIQARQLFIAIAGSIGVEHLDKLQVEVIEFQSSTTVNVKPHDDDFGKVCGSGGVMIRALQSLFSIFGNCHGINLRFILGNPLPGRISPKPPFVAAKDWDNESVRSLAEMICLSIFVKRVTVEARDVGDTTTIEILPMSGEIYSRELEMVLTTIFSAVGKAQGRNHIFIDLAKVPA